MSTTSKVMYSVRGFYDLSNETGKVMTLIGSILYSAEAIEGLRRFFELLLIIAYFFKGCEEENFGLIAILNEDFGNVPSVDVDGDDHDIGIGKQS
jgi:hypothetical protein